MKLPTPATTLRFLFVVQVALSGHLARVEAQLPADSAFSGPVLLLPAAVWDGVEDQPRRNWAVLVSKGHIDTLGPADRVMAPPGSRRIDLPGTTLIPGLIEGHSHLFLHPCSFTPTMRHCGTIRSCESHWANAWLVRSPTQRRPSGPA
jgi:imidazolonepropionase-like amidohydrolase